jgi:hypothetical protein
VRASPLFEIALVLVRLDDVPSASYNADYGMVGVLKNLAYLTT